MFQKIQELIDEKEALVFVLIDEVSLALAIKAKRDWLNNELHVCYCDGLHLAGNLHMFAPVMCGCFVLFLCWWLVEVY